VISTDNILKQLREQGERLTIQRRMVIEVLAKESSHLAVQDVQAQLAEREIDLNETTVYRILQWLKDVGVVSQTDLGQRGVVYQIIGVHPHHHLVCLNCGRVLDVDDSVVEELRERLRREFDFEPRIDHMAFFGVCPDCQHQGTDG
jgi:Fur family ferric uptake transcriptional regulator